MRNMEDLFKAINEDKLDQCLLLDVHSEEEFNGEHITGSSNLPHDSISSDDVAKLKDYQKDCILPYGRKSWNGTNIVQSWAK